MIATKPRNKLKSLTYTGRVLAGKELVHVWQDDRSGELLRFGKNPYPAKIGFRGLFDLDTWDCQVSSGVIHNGRMIDEWTRRDADADYDHFRATRPPFDLLQRISSLARDMLADYKTPWSRSEQFGHFCPLADDTWFNVWSLELTGMAIGYEGSEWKESTPGKGVVWRGDRAREVVPVLPARRPESPSFDEVVERLIQLSRRNGIKLDASNPINMYYFKDKRVFAMKEPSLLAHEICHWALHKVNQWGWVYQSAEFGISGIEFATDMAACRLLARHGYPYSPGSLQVEKWKSAWREDLQDPLFLAYMSHRALAAVEFLMAAGNIGESRIV